MIGGQRLALAALAAALLVPSCEPVPLGDGPRRLVMRRVGEAVIVPTYTELAVRAQALREAAAALQAAPGPQRLNDAQAAWRAAREPWMESQAFRFGPVMDDLVDAAIDQWPVDPAKIEAEIAGGAELTPAYIASLGANKKGFHALELLLFAAEADGGDNAVLARLAAEPRRGAYLVAAATDLADEAAALAAAWDPAGGDYLAVFAGVGDDGAAFATIKAAIDALVNESVFLSENVADGKLGKPLGKDAAGEPRPELVESPWSDNAIEDMRANLRGVRNVWLGSRDGSDAGGLGSLVHARSPAIDRRVREELAAADAALALVPRPMAAALQARDPALESAYQAVKAIRLTLAVEVVALLGATLSFNDNDGD